MVFKPYEVPSDDAVSLRRSLISAVIQVETDRNSAGKA
jgi:hypothetical protein